MSQVSKMTEEEATILNLLVEAWNRFEKLEELHPWEKIEFMQLMHQSQRFLLARPLQKTIVEEHKRKKNGPNAENGQDPTKST